MNVGIVALLISAAAQSAIAQTAPLRPTSKWSVSYEATECVVWRDFTDGSPKASLLITTSPSQTPEVALLSPDGGKAHAQRPRNAEGG